MAERFIKIRYAGGCAACSTALPARSAAWWDAAAKTMRCEACGPTVPEATAAPAPVADDSEPAPDLGPEAVVVATLKRIRVRYAGECVGCGATLPAGADALYDRSAKAMTCLSCASVEATVVDAAVAGDAATASAAEAAPAPVASQAGGSALREYERRKAKREDAIRARHPRLGGLILFLSDEPQSTTAWAKGAVGEQKLGASLDTLAAAGVVSLHDRRIPGSKANIDHLAVTPSGVWVIDAKRYSGQVAKKDVGGWFSTDVRLYVGRRDCTKLVRAMSYQVDAVRKALGTEWQDVPVRPSLCFVDAEWGFFAKPFDLEGVFVTWGKALRERLGQPGPYTPDAIATIAGHLEAKLKPAA